MRIPEMLPTWAIAASLCVAAVVMGCDETDTGDQDLSNLPSISNALPTPSGGASVENGNVGWDQKVNIAYSAPIALATGDGVTSLVSITPNDDKTAQVKSVATDGTLFSKTLVVTVVLPKPGTTYTVSVAEGLVYSADYSQTAPSASATVTTTTYGPGGTTVIPDADACGIAAAPVDTWAIQAAQDAFTFLRACYGKQIVTAAMANVDWNYAEADAVNAYLKEKEKLDKYPKIAFHDFEHLYTRKTAYDATGGAAAQKYGLGIGTTSSTNVDGTQEWSTAGGLQGASWHWEMPANNATATATTGYKKKDSKITYTVGTKFKDGNTAYKPSKSLYDCNAVLKAFEEINARLKDGKKVTSSAGLWLKEDLDNLVSILKNLQDANIALLWRPFHEASGNSINGDISWFWWGANGATAYKQLWKTLYTYLQGQGVHNLLWVWTTCTGYTDWGKGTGVLTDQDWYPGDEYVDIVGVDIYGSDDNKMNTDAKRIAGIYQAITKQFPGKMVTLSELGSLPKLSEQWQAGAYWLYAMPWYSSEMFDDKGKADLSKHANANPDWWKDAMTVGVTREITINDVSTPAAPETPADPATQTIDQTPAPGQ